MSLGEVFWIEFPVRGGHAQAGRRPAIVVQGEDASTRLPTRIVIPMTTQMDALRFPGTLLVEPTPENGLPRISIALAFQITTVDVRFFGEKSGIVSDEVMEALWTTLDGLMERLDFQEETREEISEEDTL